MNDFVNNATNDVKNGYKVFIVGLLLIISIGFFGRIRPQPYLPVDTGNIDNDFNSYRSQGFAGIDLDVISRFGDIVDDFPSLSLSLPDVDWGDWGIFNWFRDFIKGFYTVIYGMFMFIGNIFLFVINMLEFLFSSIFVVAGV